MLLIELIPDSYLSFLFLLYCTIQNNTFKFRILEQQGSHHFPSRLRALEPSTITLHNDGLVTWSPCAILGPSRLSFVNAHSIFNCAPKLDRTSWKQNSLLLPEINPGRSDRSHFTNLAMPSFCNTRIFIFHAQGYVRYNRGFILPWYGL
jgi:hypothetical protein